MYHAVMDIDLINNRLTEIKAEIKNNQQQNKATMIQVQLNKKLLKLKNFVNCRLDLVGKILNEEIDSFDERQITEYGIIDRISSSQLHLMNEAYTISFLNKLHKDDYLETLMKYRQSNEAEFYEGLEEKTEQFESLALNFVECKLFPLY